MASIARRLLDVVRGELRGVLRGTSDAHVGGSGDADQRTPAEETASAEARGRDPELARYYANLELPYGADLVAVKASWRRLARKYHPDLHSADAQKRQIAEEIVKGLNRAYEALESVLEKQGSSP